MENLIKPNFDFKAIGISKDEIKADAEQTLKAFEPIPHDEILSQLIKQIGKVDFRELAELKDETQKLNRKHYLVSSIEQVINTAKNNNWGLCKNTNFVYLYNGAYWRLFNDEELKTFLGNAAEKMGVDKFDAKHYKFIDELLKQFLALANLPKPEQAAETVLINLKNGTFEISPKRQFLRGYNSNDFLTYQLPFDYNPTAEAPLFHKYLNTVQPDIERQKILAEFLGYVFLKTSYLKLEKMLVLFGGGRNGKSVFFEIVTALLGSENVSSYSLSSLVDENGYYRAMIGNKLVNYASEMNCTIKGNNFFKQLTSGEPIQARLPRGYPFEISNYAKLIFNCNELPKDVEQTNAYFGRYLIIPFDVTIPDHEQDAELSKKIINNELSGVFNWLLEGLNRLIAQKKFTESEAVKQQLNDFKKQSDSVLLFLEDEGYQQSTNESYLMFSEVYNAYKIYCIENGNHSCSGKSFSERLKKSGFVTDRKNTGKIIYAVKTGNNGF